MENLYNWDTGLNYFRKHYLDSNNYTISLTEIQYEPGRDINLILNDHLLSNIGGSVELLYSGGLDSELVLKSLLYNKVKVEAMTLVIKIKGAILNTRDLYYSEKFCRENNIKQNLFFVDAIDFFESKQYLNYLLPYKITKPHVATHMWLIEQCHNYPIMGGDWPWVQMHNSNKVLSPNRLDYTSYDRFMNDKNITGIGNMLGHSFESCIYFIKKQLLCYEPNFNKQHNVFLLKHKMYMTEEPRFGSFGWEHCNPELFNYNRYEVELLTKIGLINHTIKWGEEIKTLLSSTVNTNSQFN